jgi:hypothetical protein
MQRTSEPNVPAFDSLLTSDTTQADRVLTERRWNTTLLPVWGLSRRRAEARTTQETVSAGNHRRSRRGGWGLPATREGALRGVYHRRAEAFVSATREGCPWGRGRDLHRPGWTILARENLTLDSFRSWRSACHHASPIEGMAHDRRCSRRHPWDECKGRVQSLDSSVSLGRSPQGCAMNIRQPLMATPCAAPAANGVSLDFVVVRKMPHLGSKFGQSVRFRVCRGGCRRRLASFRS